MAETSSVVDGAFDDGGLDVTIGFMILADFGDDVESGAGGVDGGNGAGGFFGRRIERRSCSVLSNSLILRVKMRTFQKCIIFNCCFLLVIEVKDYNPKLKIDSFGILMQLVL